MSDDERRTALGIVAQPAPPVPEPQGAAPTPPAWQPSPQPDETARPELAMHHVAPVTSAQVETLSRHFLGISLRRAFRLAIHTDEVLPSERAHLESRASHIRDPDQQAFLAWRRSVLLLVAIMFVPLTISRFIESFEHPGLPLAARMFVLLPAVAEALFCIVAFEQLRNWAAWNKQRRIMFWAWAFYFVAPFLVYLYPFRYAYDGSIYAARAAAEIGGVHLNASNQTVHMAVGLAFGVQALLALGPKIISLMPGLIRASIVSKLLFPGTTAPGWLIMLAAPFYTLFAFIIVLLPYQITGSWQFVVGNGGILFAQIYIGSAGRRLTVPLTMQESHDRIHQSWLWYIGILVISAGFMVYGLADFISQMHLGAIRVVTSLLTVVSNVLLDTLIGTDAIVAAMSHFRKREAPDPAQEQLLRDAEIKLDVFCR